MNLDRTFVAMNAFLVGVTIATGVLHKEVTETYRVVKNGGVKIFYEYCIPYSRLNRCK
jgi:hypothetical protein